MADLPGFTLPLDYTPCDGHDKPLLFPSALDDFASLITLREIAMLRIMDKITDKPQWDVKVFDEDIVKKWKEEALRNDNNVTERMMEWVMAELRYKTKFFQETGMVIVNDAAGVVKSDVAVTESIKKALKNAVRPLEETPTTKDYHPRGDNKFLDLVDPSLFPLVYGRSRILQDELAGIHDCLSKIGKGEAIPIPQLEVDRTRPLWLRWLPCDVELESESRCKITSYINNLHPRRHKGLYQVIEDIISCAIPQWGLSLTAVHRTLRWEMPGRHIEYREVKYEYPEHLEQPQQEPNEDDDAFEERRWLWERENRVVVLPEPGTFTPRDYLRLDLRKEFKDTGLQVIVKLANIHLTPEEPEYEGGSWHVEGQLNEHICATALLEFRQEVSFDAYGRVRYEQEDYHEWLQEVFGCEQGVIPLVQEIGDVLCKEGRLLTFPNVLQHRVSPFRLADPTKPGHRKILALFLVDPNIRIISTANVPPQQDEWWREEIRRHKLLGMLPTELQEQVLDELDFPLRMEEAEALRLALLDDRKAFKKEKKRSSFLSGESNPGLLCPIQS
ncbi:hypothetical protein T310_0108 [Rasamsonia emersonii CBS 393.64]|uniref:Uncharacterized protein n=1 Tax=Rasamsonia emersonii (strain ATCC 16479 / CBS 393.64 / IMI 116815) TaxID=1408163 RepID=A0A0F4Z6E6_RASE3|nr:hypothetical protein T310_0108 [Rasamsonia emersonii CBS 393.64]KKA25905.1 hypothetical protein T310_0108 [Rasamsonia emersonii CBS 393.64]